MAFEVLHGGKMNVNAWWRIAAERGFVWVSFPYIPDAMVHAAFHKQDTAGHQLIFLVNTKNKKCWFTF